jgi:hypothetical protein
MAKLSYVAVQLIFSSGHWLVKPDQTSWNKTSADVSPECVAVHNTCTVDFCSQFGVLYDIKEKIRCGNELRK